MDAIGWIVVIAIIAAVAVGPIIMAVRRKRDKDSRPQVKEPMRPRTGGSGRGVKDFERDMPEK